MIEPPYGIILNHLKSGDIVPFLGAGCSLSGRPGDFKWREAGAGYLPKAAELAGLLADDAAFPSSEPRDRQDLAKVASYYLDQSERPDLVACLRNVFDRDYNIGEVHRLLAELPQPMLIVTTNYDDLIEQAFRQKEKKFHLVVHPTENKELAAAVLWWKPGDAQPRPYPPATLPLSVTDTTIIYKMHGGIDRQAKTWDSFVVTEEDYVDFLSRMMGKAAIPARFMLHFRSRPFLFLGYGLADWNLRVLLKTIRSVPRAAGEPDDRNEPDSEEAHRSWAIQYQPSELEKMLWEARKVRIYDIDIDAFVRTLRERMK